MTRLLALALLLATASSAHAEPWVFKYDEFPEGLSAAAAQVNGGQFYTQPGFVRGEAFGQIYRPLPEMFPLQIIGFDLILAAPPYTSGPLFTNAIIEVYNSESKTADPGVAPIFAISTDELFNPKTQDFGFPLQGNTGLSIEFDMTQEDNRPPLFTSGNIWLMIRFQDEAMSLSSEWASLACFQVPGLICGCQNVGTVHDSSIVKNVNVLNHMAPLGSCSGPAMGWTYMEDVPSTDTGFTIAGDVILRLRADVASGPCVPECNGNVCGDDGCGGSCGSCGERSCVDGACVDCQPNCLSKQCGDNGCGGSCGTCGTNQTCGSDAFCHDPCVADCAGRQCGDDACGGSCGTCAAGDTCAAGRCQPPTEVCVPMCAERACGDDGCGNRCGDCTASERCDDGVCTAIATDFAVTNISPATGLVGIATRVSITGKGFASDTAVKVGASDCTDVVVTGDALISALVPALSAGRYSVIVVNPDARVATLPDAFQVEPVDPTDPIEPVGPGTKDEGCSGGSAASGALALAFMAAFARRRGA